MKRLLLAAALLAAGFLGYRFLRQRQPNGPCERFVEAWAREDRAAAGREAEPDAVRHAFDEAPLRGTPGGAAMEAFRGTTHAIESSTRKDDGDVDLVIRQTILFDPPGATTGIGGAMYARFRHRLTARHTPDGWKVVQFDREYLEMGETRKRR